MKNIKCLLIIIVFFLSLIRFFFRYTFERMKTLFACLLIFILFACNNRYSDAETALDGGREFIDGCLKGDFKKAAYYMINDSENESDLLKIKRDYDTESAEQKEAYATASIIIHEDAAINDSIHIINYENSYDKTARKVKVVKRNGSWLVDFKYTFNGNL